MALFDLLWPLERRLLTWVQIWQRNAERAFEEESIRCLSVFLAIILWDNRGFVDACTKIENVDFFNFADIIFDRKEKKNQWRSSGFLASFWTFPIVPSRLVGAEIEVGRGSGCSNTAPTLLRGSRRAVLLRGFLYQYGPIMPWKGENRDVAFP